MIKHHIDQEFAFPAYAVLMGNNIDTAGQLYVDIVRYLQENKENFNGYRLRGNQADLNKLWLDVKV